MIALLFAAAVVTAAPPTDQDAMMLAREIASQGLLATIAPMQTTQEIEALVTGHPELEPDQAERLRAIGRDRSAALIDSAIEAEATALAAHLSIEDLRALAEFARSPTSRRYREAFPGIMAATIQSLGTVDYRGGVIETFCSETALLCEE